MVDIEEFTDIGLEEELVKILREMQNRGFDLTNLDKYVKRI